jgi:hypothetical protein
MFTEEQVSKFHRVAPTTMLVPVKVTIALELATLRELGDDVVVPRRFKTKVPPELMFKVPGREIVTALAPPVVKVPLLTDTVLVEGIVKVPEGRRRDPPELILKVLEEPNVTLGGFQVAVEIEIVEERAAVTAGVVKTQPDPPVNTKPLKVVIDVPLRVIGFPVAQVTEIELDNEYVLDPSDFP